MRKIFLVVFLAVFSLLTVQAQKKSLGKKSPDWGLKTGINLSTFNTKLSADVSWHAGFVAGAFFRIHAAKNFAIQPELLFSSMGAYVDDGIMQKTSMRVNYFSIPVLAKIGLVDKFSVVVGPQFDFLLQARNVNSASSEKTTNNYRDHSVNATAGIEYWAGRRVGVSVRYIHGFTNIIEGSGSGISTSVKNQGVQATIAFKL